MGSAMEVSEKIRILRNRSGITQQQLAEVLGVQRNTITQYEAGRIVPSSKSLKKIADLFSVSIDFLMNKELEIQAKDIPAMQRPSFGNSYFDSIFNITVKKIYEQFVTDNDFYIANKEVIFRIIESLLFINIQARKTNQTEILLYSKNKTDFDDLNERISEFSKQLARMEKLQGLMEEK